MWKYLKHRGFPRFDKDNKGNWQGIYQVNTNVSENEELKMYIENNKVLVAKELSKLTGIAFDNHVGVNTLFDNLYKSFIDNGGLYREKWHPETVLRILLINAAPVKFWGYMVSNEVADKIKESDLRDSLD